VLIFKAGIVLTGQRVHAATYHYGRAQQLFAVTMRNTAADALAEAIRRDVARRVPARVGGQPISEITVQEDFGVEKKVNAGIQIPVTTITLGPNASYDRNDVHQVKMIFAIGTAPANPAVSPSPH
jgi:hypothetical protein